MAEQQKRKVLSLINKFRPEELPSIVEEVFTKFTWQEIKSLASSNKINILKIRNLATLCLTRFQDYHPSAQEIQNVLWYLTFFDSMNHNNLVWQCAVMSKEEERFPSDLDELHQRILRTYRSEAMNTEIIMKLKDNIVWTMLIEKIITKRGIKYGKPFYAAFHVDLKKHVFYTPKQGNSDYLQLFSKALGFESYKQIKFEGKDVRNMFEMIKRCRSNDIVLYQPNAIQVERNIVDFTQGRARSNYANSILPPGSTNLSEFTIYSKNQWRGEIMKHPQWAMFVTQLKIKTVSKRYSVEDVLRALIIMNLVQIPVPEFILKLPALDRNFIKIKEENDEEEENEEIDQSNL